MEEEYEFGVGVSSVCFGEEGIRHAYQQAREMIKINFYEEAGILYYGDSPEIGKVLPREAQELSDRAAEFVKCRQYEAMEDGFRKVLHICRMRHTDPRLILHWLKAMDERLGIGRGQEEYAGIIGAGQLMEICEDYRQRLFTRQPREIPEHAGTSVRRVVDYLQAHYKEQIGLSEAAEAAGLNPAYLSFLFKQEMGVGFSAYLLELRMEYAKALLGNTNDKIKAVASRAGFNDYHYFSKAFKKMNGCSPVEYRKRI